MPAIVCLSFAYKHGKEFKVFVIDDTFGKFIKNSKSPGRILSLPVFQPGPGITMPP